MIKDFIKNVKEYVSYLMKVNFKELFINTGIIICIVLLSTVVYIPLKVVGDLLRSFIDIFVRLVNKPALLFDWVKELLCLSGCFVAFMYLFNKRFSDLEAFKKQINSKNNKADIKNDKDTNNQEEIELPKIKQSK